jgi:hypothetical protein
VSQDLDPSVVRRLAFIRFLYRQGLEQAKRPQPLAATALLCFHDAVEMFLLLAAEHLLGVAVPKNTAFEGYWDLIAAKANVELPGRAPMRRMNKSRVSFKHHGYIPSADTLEEARSGVSTFLTNATRLVFGTDLTSLDMIDLVTQQPALTYLRDAEAQARQGDFVMAVFKLSPALNTLLSDYEQRKRTAQGTSAYDLGPIPGDPFRYGYTFLSTKRQPPVRPETNCVIDTAEENDKGSQLTVPNARLGEDVEDIKAGMAEIRRVVEVLALGLDYRRYVRFTMLIPPASYSEAAGLKPDPVPGLRMGDDEYQFCKQFVIEAALHLAEMDFDLDLYRLRVDEEA